MEVEVPLAVGPELLVGDQVGLVDRVAIGQLIDISTSHATLRPGCGDGGVSGVPGRTLPVEGRL